VQITPEYNKHMYLSTLISILYYWEYSLASELERITPSLAKDRRRAHNIPYKRGKSVKMPDGKEYPTLDALPDVPQLDGIREHIEEIRTLRRMLENGEI